MSAVENIRSALEKWRKAKTMQEACEADDEYGDATDQDVMADDAIQSAWLSHNLYGTVPHAFVLGIRAAERFNGIKDDTK